jgi:hypothetical protein
MLDVAPLPEDFQEQWLRTAVEEARGGATADVTMATRSDSTTRVLRFVAQHGAARIPWVDGLREIFCAELQRTVALLFKLFASQIASASVKGLGNNQRFENAAAVDEFSADNEYMLTELQSLTRAPFTSQRLAEILLNPFKYHTVQQQDALTNAGTVAPETDAEVWQRQLAAVRPLVVQNALRKTVLVTPTGLA